jgi:hypothetical protein
MSLNMKLVDYLKHSCAALALTGTAAFAEEAVEMKDVNANYTMQLGGGTAWAVDVDRTGDQSTIVAASPDGYEPFTIVSAMTYLEVNPMAMMGGSIKEKTVDSFLSGLCENYECVDISDKVYEDISGRKAWVVTTMLDLDAYADMGIPEAVMIATASPEGYMQLFSLHTAQGQAEEFKPLLIEAVKTIQPLTP